MKTCYLGIVVLFFLAILGCKQNNNQIKNENFVTDYFGRTVKTPFNLQKVITLYYVQAEIICAIGAKEKIVGIGKVTQTSSFFLKTYFPSILTLPQVGQGNISYEKIIALDPDVIFTGAEKPVVEKLEHLGYLAIATYPKNLEEILDEINFYGKVLGKENQSLKIYSLFRKIANRINEISKKIPQKKIPNVYYIRTDALTSIGGNIQGEIINLAGGKLITEGIGDNATSLQMSFEDIYRYNPDVIIIRDRATIKPEDLYKDKRWENINAVMNKKVFQEHTGWTEYRLETIFGIIEKAKWLHPELFIDIDPDLEYKKFIELVKENSK